MTQVTVSLEKKENKWSFIMEYEERSNDLRFFSVLYHGSHHVDFCLSHADKDAQGQTAATYRQQQKQLNAHPYY